MSSNQPRLPFFPTPYPDEILYSILCRYHSRCGKPAALQTNRELWGNNYGKKLFLPDGIERITARIPQSANLTAERFINENTVFPFLKPFMAQEKCDALIAAMKFGDPNIYNILGFAHVFTLQHRRMRFCSDCIERDMEKFGEPYWHRVHQLPGVHVCPKHNTATVESGVEVAGLCREYYPLLPAMGKPILQYEPDIVAKLSDFACDMEWLLQHGGERDCFEHTSKLYDNWLRVKGYRHKSGKTNGRQLAQDIVGYYGQGFLAILDAYNSGACTWMMRIIQQRSFQHPLYHLLLMRFLAGTPKYFFMGTQEKVPEYLPYGAPPYPCRNVICEHHLQDVIVGVEVVNVKGNYRATFVCPHCGFTYRRKMSLPKEQQYAGQVDIAAYGWKWEQTVARRLAAGESPYAIARDVRCDVRTILTFGVDCGLLSTERLIKRIGYVPSEIPQKKLGFHEQRDQYRQRWQDAIATNPEATRNELRRLDSKADQWLHAYDANWLDENSPPSKRNLPRWAGCDEDYLERIDDAVKQIRDSPGIPKRLSLAAIGRAAGIPKPHVRLISDYLPKTKAFVMVNTETHEQWQKRKILRAIRQMRERGEVITVYKVRHRATIEDPGRKLDEFIAECIVNSG